MVQMEGDGGLELGGVLGLRTSGCIRDVVGGRAKNRCCWIRWMGQRQLTGEQLDQWLSLEWGR